LWPWRQPEHWAPDRAAPCHGDPSRSRRAHNSRTEYDQLSLLRFFSLGKARGLVPLTPILGTRHLQTRTNKEGRELAIHLETIASRFAHEDPVLVIHAYTGWTPKILFPFHPPGALPLAPHLRIGVQLVLTPFGDRGITGARGGKTTISVEDLQAIVQPVGHVDDTIVIHCHAGGAVELPFARARLANLHQEAAIRAKLLNAVVAPVGDIDIALTVEVDTPGHIELAITMAVGAPFGQEAAILGEFLDAVIAAVHNVDVIISIKGHARGAIEFAIATPRALGPFAYVIPILREDGNPIQPLIRYVDTPLAVKGDGGGPDHGAIVEVKFVWPLCGHAACEGR